MKELSALEKHPPADTEIIGRRVIILDRIDSTNACASEMAGRGRADEGTVIIADVQTGGRGRFGHAWFAPPGGSLLMSVVLTPEIAAERLPAVTAVGALAVTETVRGDFGLDALVRWPNDAVINGLKFAGVLARAERFGRPGQCFILGIGLNVNVERSQFPPEFSSSATSLKIETGADVSRESVARGLFRRIDVWYGRLREGRFDEIERMLRTRSSLTGRTVTLEHGGERHTGKVIDISLAEGIRLEMPDRTARWFPESVTTLLAK